MAHDVLELQVPADAEGQRLDRFLRDRDARWTRSGWGRLIRDGQVDVDGRPASKPGLVLRAGMQVRANLPPPCESTLEAESIPLTVVHEDDALLVVDKPSGMAVHPGHGRRSGTLVHALLGRRTTLAPTGAPERPGIVHRLDLGTSGLIIVAKTDDAHRALSRAFARREVRKTYLALVWGCPNPAEGAIERPIGRSRADALKMSVTATRGRAREALTRFETVECFPGLALLRVRPRTGRTHQIRVHLQSIHHPLVGDDRYGGKAWRGVQHPLHRRALRDFDRLALHASALSFRHPVTGETLALEAPLPAAFEALLAVLRTP